MDDLLNKALDVFEPLQTKISNAIDSTLDEYPKPIDSMPNTIFSGEVSTELPLVPSTLDGAKRVLAYWEEMDIEGNKATWDEQGVAINQNQEASTRNRKTLADQTKIYKQGDKKDVAPLLKLYQVSRESCYLHCSCNGIVQRECTDVCFD